MLSKDTLREKALHLIEYAKHSKEEDLDNVIEEFVNFVREQKVKSLQEALQIYKNKGNYETIVKKREGKTPPKLSEGPTL